MDEELAPERQENSGGIRRSAAQPAADRQVLLQGEIRAEPAAGLIFQQARRAQNEVLFAERSVEGQAIVAARRDADAIRRVDQAKDRLQLVVAVGALAEDVEEEIELRRRRPPLHRHSVMAKRS